MGKAGDIERFGKGLFLRLDSRHADYEPNSKTYSINLNGAQGLSNVRRIVLYQCDIFNLQSNINANNNVITIDGVDYTIPVGQYSVADFVTNVNASIVASGLQLILPLPTSLRFDIQNTTGAPVVISDSPLYDYLGLLGESTTVPATSTITAPTVYDLSGLNEIVLESRELFPSALIATGQNNRAERFDYGMPIPIGVNYRSRQVYQPAHHEQCSFNYEHREEYAVINVRLLDAKNLLPIDNLLAPWSLIFKIYREFE